MSLADILKLATAISLLAPLFVAIAKWLQDRARRKQDLPGDTASAAQIVQGMTLELLAPLRQQVQDLQLEITSLREQVRQLNTELENERRRRRLAEDQRDAAYDKLEQNNLQIPQKGKN